VAAEGTLTGGGTGAGGTQAQPEAALIDHHQAWHGQRLAQVTEGYALALIALGGADRFL
jgi:hypothetical protein